MLTSSSPFNLYLILSSENSQSPLSLFFLCPYFCHCFGTCKVFGTYSDKYHPCTSMWALVSVVSSTTHTSLVTFMCCLYVTKVPSYYTCFQLDFHCCFLSPFLVVPAQGELPITKHTGPFQPYHPHRVALTLYITSVP